LNLHRSTFVQENWTAHPVPSTSYTRTRPTRRNAVSTVAWITGAVSFVLCIAPTFISYRPYEFSWDDSDYLLRAIRVSRAFWSGNVHGLGSAMVSGHAPIMTLFGLPWGTLTSKNAAGDCFVALAMVTALLAATCLYLLLRIGVKPIFLVIAGLCVGASLGPIQAGEHANHMHDLATRFLADNVFAWATLAIVLLIPYEARTAGSSIRGVMLRAILCGSISSLGALTKVSFLYFIGLVVPVVVVIRLWRGGIRSALVWFIAFICSVAPVAVYFLRFGRSAFAQGEAASFGGLAEFYYVPLGKFLAATIFESPGLILSLMLIAVTCIYLAVKKRPSVLHPGLIALLIMFGYLAIVLASPSKQIRYLFPAMVAVPFLLTVLACDEEDSVPTPRARLLAVIVFLGLAAAAAPLRHRPYQQSLSGAQAILAQAARCNAKSIILATDSPTLNVFLLNLASELSSSPSSQTSIRTLAYQAMSGAPIQDDLDAIANSDMVVFQDAARLRPQFTNQRVPEYEQYVRRAGLLPARMEGDVNLYSACTALRK